MQKTKRVTGISHQETVTYKFILQRDLTLSESVTGSSLKMQKMKRVTGILHPETVIHINLFYTEILLFLKVLQEQFGYLPYNFYQTLLEQKQYRINCENKIYPNHASSMKENYPH